MAKTNSIERAITSMGVSGRIADLARSIYKQESGSGTNTKASNAGAMGGMQMLQSTFNSVADKGWNINDPDQNAMAGIRYLQQLNKQSGGNSALTAAGYYGGPGGMEKARRGVAVTDPRNPNAPNTLQYGQQVVARMPTGNSPSILSMPDSVVAQRGPPPEAPQPMEVAPPAAMQDWYAQFAQEPVPEYRPQEVAQVQEPVAVEKADPWASMQQAMPQVILPSALAYGRPTSQQEVVQPNFSRFSAFKGRS